MGAFSYYDFGNTEACIFDNFLIIQTKEGESLDIQEAEEFKIVFKEHFKDKNTALISNRVASYSINPLAYKFLEEIPNLIAIALVVSGKKTRASAEYEKNFYAKPFDIFNSLPDAIKWVSEQIEKENNKT